MLSLMKKSTTLAVVLVLLSLSANASITPPGEYLGFAIGTDRKLADYNEVMGYLERLSEESDRVKVVEFGKTTLGKPFIMAVLSTEENLKNLARYIEISRKLTDPRKINDSMADELVANGKTLVMITCNLHSTEIASSQMALELAYEIATGSDERLNDAMEDVILFLIPSLNPDGLQMVVDWYEKWVGTEYEGCSMPWLYHHYAGHDNNRDWFMVNLPETRAVFDLYFRKVLPHVILDMHQMWSTGARLFLPPFYPPANRNVDPILYREISLIGSYMQLACEERNLKGVISDAYFTAYWEGTSMMTPWWHNQVGLLSEMASARIATPVYVDPVELRGGAKGFPRYEQSLNFPNPWPGGRWSLRDIVDYELVIAKALIECSALNRESFLRNYYRMGKRAVLKGRTEAPYAYVLPAPFEDPVNVARMIEALMLGGVEVHRAESSFRLGNRVFLPGSFVIKCSQPYRNYVKDLLEVQDYPDIRESKKQPYIRPYDVTAWTLWMQMGVECVEADEPVKAKLALLEKFPYPETGIPPTAVWGYALDCRVNASYAAVNRLLDENIQVERSLERINLREWGAERARVEQLPHSGKMKKPGGNKGTRIRTGSSFRAPLPAGSFIVRGGRGVQKICSEISKDLHVEFVPILKDPGIRTRKLKAADIALFKPWVASMDEGWTRLLLDRYFFSYRNVSNEDIRKGAFRKCRVLLIPSINPSIIVEGKPSGEYSRYFRPLPPDYTGGIGKEGKEKIKEFVEDGGTLICFDASTKFAIETFELPITNVLEKVKSDDFFCPGSILKVSFKKDHPLTYGMPEKGYILFRNSPAFVTSIPYGKIDRSIAAWYTDKNPLASGLLIGPDRLYRRAALVEVKYGEGRIVLFGFRPQHRCQTTGTYKLVFNSIFEAY